MTIPADIKTKLIATLLSNGYRIREDSHLIFIAIKEFDTAVGIREASAVVFSGDPTRLSMQYDSRGGNALGLIRPALTDDIGAALATCDKLVDQSFARRLLLRFNARAA